MKQLLFGILLLSQCVFAQGHRKEMADSKIYIRATYFDQNNEFIGLQLRTDLGDTLIENSWFQKFKTDDFVVYPEIEKTSLYYESFSDGTYQLLDAGLETVHELALTQIEEQTATLFGTTSKIALEYIDTRTSYPRDSLVPTDKTPRKFYRADNEEVYAIIIPDLETVAVSSNGQFYTKQLFGDNYNDISEGIANNFQAHNRFDIQPQDEIQLFYRRKWYNNETGLAEYEDKQFKNVTYLGDTLIDGNRSLRLEIEGYNYLSGAKEGPDEFLIPISEEGYYYGNLFIPFQNYTTDLRIIEQNGEKSFFLQGVSKDTIDGFTYEKIVQATPGSYRYFVLPFFPMPYIEFGNVEGVITYSKIKGVEKGSKRERTYITNKNNVRDLYTVSESEVAIDLYFLDPYEVSIEIKDPETDGLIGELQTTSEKGVNSYKITTEKMQKGKSYSVLVDYKSEGNSGSFSNGFKAKH